jgi:hypothetical protein
VALTGRLAGHRIDVYRVEMDKCRDCGTLTPTAEGLMKIDRCAKRGIEFFLEHLPAESPAPRKKRARCESRSDLPIEVAAGRGSDCSHEVFAGCAIGRKVSARL